MRPPMAPTIVHGIAAAGLAGVAIGPLPGEPRLQVQVAVSRSRRSEKPVLLTVPSMVIAGTPGARVPAVRVKVSELSAGFAERIDRGLFVAMAKSSVRSRAS